MSRDYTEDMGRLYGTDVDRLSCCRIVTLQTNDSCNLACTYCYQKCKGNRIMQKETAKEIIDYLFDMYNADDPDGFINHKTQSVVLEFIGGEPFLAIDLIDWAVGYFWKTALEKNHIWASTFRVSITSNGTKYFDEKVQQFIRRYRNRLSLSITVDGDKEMHDSCRGFQDGKGSWEAANAAQMHYHRVYGGHLGTKVTIAPENLEYLDRIIDYFIQNGYQEINANTIYEADWTIEQAQVFYKKLKIVADKLLSLEKEIPCSLFHKDFFKPLPPEENQNWCGGNGLMLAFDPDGDAYPCLRYMESSLNGERKPLRIGNSRSGIYQTREEKEIRKELSEITRRSQSTDECFNCPVAAGCSWCTAWNYQKFGTANKRDTASCWMHKARSVANYYYWSKKGEKIDLCLPYVDLIRIVSETELKELLEGSEE